MITSKRIYTTPLSFTARFACIGDVNSRDPLGSGDLRGITFLVTCWEGQNPHLQVTALAFFASRPVRLTALGTDDPGARSIWSGSVGRWSGCGEAGEAIPTAGDETGGASAGRSGTGVEVLQPTSGGRPSAELGSVQDLSP